MFFWDSAAKLIKSVKHYFYWKMVMFHQFTSSFHHCPFFLETRLSKVYSALTSVYPITGLRPACLFWLCSLEIWSASAIDCDLIAASAQEPAMLICLDLHRLQRLNNTGWLMCHWIKTQPWCTTMEVAQQSRRCDMKKRLQRVTSLTYVLEKKKPQKQTVYSSQHWFSAIWTSCHKPEKLWPLHCYISK